MIVIHRQGRPGGSERVKAVLLWLSVLALVGFVAGLVAIVVLT